MAIDHHPEALVSTGWLAAHVDDPDLRIFECTTFLRPAAPGEGVPYHPEAGRADYEAGHVPGAGFLDLPGELSRQDAHVAFMMLPAARFAEVAGRHGIGDGTRVVLYSRDRVMWATRAWWMLHVMGFSAAVLDGGLEKWIAEGREVSTEPCAYPPATFTPRPQPALMLDKSAVLAAIDDPATCLVNTLSVADFRGEEPSRYGRPGHIPRSVNLPWPELTDPQNGTFIPLEEARHGSRRSAPRMRIGSSAIVAAASRRPRPCSCCTASVTATSHCTTHRWPSGRATSACPSSAAEATDDGGRD